MLQLFDSIRKRKARIAVMIVAALVCDPIGAQIAGITFAIRSHPQKSLIIRYRSRLLP